MAKLLIARNITISLLAAAILLHDIFSNIGLRLRDDPTTLKTKSSYPEDLPVPAEYTVPLRNMTGTWIGNTWIPPPPWRYFSAEDMRTLLGGRRILWIGDSTSRRAAMNMFAVLNNTGDPHIGIQKMEKDINVNKRVKSDDCETWKAYTANQTGYPNIDVCRPLYPQGGEIALLDAACIQGLRNFLLAETKRDLGLLRHYDVIIISLGIWHDVRPRDCRLIDGETISAVTNEAIEILGNITSIELPDIRIIWRTGGWKKDVAHESHKATLEFNRVIMDTIDGHHSNSSTMSYVNWGDAVLPRSFEERIVGDLKPHYGLEPRHVLVQMIANQVERMDQMNAVTAKV